MLVFRCFEWKCILNICLLSIILQEISSFRNFQLSISNYQSLLYAGGRPPKQSVPSPEENLNLKISIESIGFLNNIIEYGNNRMARRAVGILQKMPAYGVLPQEEHFTQAIWACEKGSQFQLAISVYDEMKAKNIRPTLSTFEALISVAEKANHLDESYLYFQNMKEEGLKGTTSIYNSVLFALEKSGQYQLAFDLLNEMKEQDIPRDIQTYTSCIWACEKVGEAETALQILQLMNIDNVEAYTNTYNAALWACIKGGYCYDALRLFDDMELKKIPRDADSYNAAIWACELTSNPKKAVMMLRKMKLDKCVRTAMSFDGAISAVSKAGDWRQMLEILGWMQRDQVEKSIVTYRLAIDCLDQYHQDEMIGEFYSQAFRDGYFNPWVKKTRTLDIRGFSLAVAKIALRTVFLSMLEGKLTLFPLKIIVGDFVMENDKEYISSSFDDNQLYDYLSTLHIKSTGMQIEDHRNTLNVIGTRDANNCIFTITREELVNWINMHRTEMNE
jgi:pentatricopeptide repeat protein